MGSALTARLFLRAKAGWYLFAAFFGAALVYGALLAMAGVYPFGPKSILIYDMGNQYADFHAYYQQVLHGHAGLGFTWRADLGMNFLPLFAYYLASPFSLLVALSPERYLPEAMVLIIMLKIGAGSAAMAALLRRIAAGSKALAAAFAIPYALSAWTIVYAFNIMWLDALYLLPLLLIAAEVLLARGRLLPLAAACAASALISYYMFGIMLPFLLVYLCARWAGTAPLTAAGFGRLLAKVAIPLGAGVLAAGILLAPTYFGLVNGRTDMFGQDMIPVPVPWSAQIARFFGGSQDTMTGCPALSASTLTVVAASIFPFLRSIRRAERLAFAGLAVLLMAASQNQIVYLLFHDGERPNAWAFRYAFLVPALFAILGYRALTALHGPGALAALRRSALVWLGVLIVSSLLQPQILPPRVALPAVAAIVAGTLASGLVARFGAGPVRAASRSVAFLAAVLVLDGGVAAALDSAAVHYPSRASWNTQPTKDWNQAMKSTAPGPGQFFRADGLWADFANGTLRSENESLRDGDFAQTHFSSLSSGRLHDALAELGFSEHVYRIWASHTGASILTDALFDYRYFTAPAGPKTVPPDRIGLLPVRRWPTAVVYQNTMTLPVGFLAPARLPADLAGLDPFSAQEQVFDLPGAFGRTCPAAPRVSGAVVDASVPGRLTFLRDAKQHQVTVTWHCHAAGARQLYAWPSFPRPIDAYPVKGLFQVQLDRGRPQGYPSVYDNGLLDLGSRTNADFSVTVTSGMRLFTLPVDFVRGLDTGRAAQRIAELNRVGLHDVTATGSGLSGTIDAPRAGQVFLSVPAIRGWGRPTVDGRPVSATVAASAFLTVPVGAGHHVIALRFHPPGLRLGAGLSALGLLALALIGRHDRRRGAAAAAPAETSGLPPQRDTIEPMPNSGVRA